MSPGPGRDCELVRAYACPLGEVDRYVAESARARLLMDDLTRTSMADGPLLIRGETGTGKTLLARTIHTLHGQAGELRTVSCAALSDGLLAEVLGVPTSSSALQGAEETLLLDEVSELSPWGQAVVMHRLRLAPPRRLLAATQRDLGAMAEAGEFSRELLACLSGEHVRLAPLRRRRDEIVPLARHFLALALAATQTPCVMVDGAMLDCLERYRWPGNARELKNAMFRALAFNESGTVGLADLPERVRSDPRRLTVG